MGVNFDDCCKNELEFQICTNCKIFNRLQSLQTVGKMSALIYQRLLTATFVIFHNKRVCQRLLLLLDV